MTTAWEIQELRGQEAEGVEIRRADTAHQALQLADIPLDAKSWPEVPTYLDIVPIGKMLVDPEDETHAYCAEPIA